jgi:hypothetical protein
MTFEERIQKAKKHNEVFDAIGKKHGNCTPAEAGPDACFSCGMEAIKAGLVREDIDMVAEGYLLLQQFGELYLEHKEAVN